MGIKEKIQNRKKQKNINLIMKRLKYEYEISYELSYIADEKLYKDFQPYAKTMYDLLEYYSSKNTQICDALLNVVAKYGKVSVRVARRDRTGEVIDAKETIKLLLPPEITEKLKKLESKMNKEKNEEQSELVRKLDELAK